VSRIGVLGTGGVGRTVGAKLVGVGHEVKLGSRAPGGEAATAWVAEAGEGASEGSFADAAAFGELVVNATAGAASLAALEGAGAENLAGKVLWDIAIPLDWSTGALRLGVDVTSEDSLAEQIQRAHPDAQVVKALCTLNSDLMVDPAALDEQTNIFVCGNERAAKVRVIEILETFGWLSGDIIDLGDLSAARGMEAYVLMWVSVMRAVGSPLFNVRVVRATGS
jgi:8-hydroxy-5-deazaflavin:NADPH oxidoreductase